MPGHDPSAANCDTGTHLAKPMDSMTNRSTQGVVEVQYQKLVECSAIEQAAADDQVLLTQQIQQVRTCLALTTKDVAAAFMLSTQSAHR